MIEGSKFDIAGVAPETTVLTKDGSYPICELIDKECKVWNGKKWTSTIIRKSGTNQKLLKVVLEGGHTDPPKNIKNKNLVEIYCAEHHSFLIKSEEWNFDLDQKKIFFIQSTY
jgi:hypothetical protein